MSCKEMVSMRFKSGSSNVTLGDNLFSQCWKLTDVTLPQTADRISAGMFVSIISKSTPLSKEAFALSHLMTAKALEQIGKIGGPRCCKRDSFLSILSAIDFVFENFGIQMERP